MTLVDRLNGVTSGVAVKAPARVATIATVVLSGLQTIDGVALAERDRVLVKDQADPAENGLYDAAPGAWSRSLDFNGSRDVVEGTRVLVVEGATNARREFYVTTPGPIIFGSTEVEFQTTVTDDNITAGLAGGADGQVLTKQSGADYDYAWETPSGGGGGAVNSVNGQTGTVVLNAASVGARPDTYVPAFADITSKPTTLTGYGITDGQPLDSDLTALAALAATAGMLSRTGAGAFAARTLTAPAAGITITNPTGSGGNPTLALANDLSAVEALSSTGIARRTGTDTWSVGTTVATAEIADDAVTNAKLANMAASTFKGRVTASTGDPEDLTGTQATSLLNAVVGDSGSGGTKGLVPAPGAGDAAAGKFLKANGAWDVPSGSGSGDVVGPSSAANNGVALFDGTTGKLLKDGGALGPLATASSINNSNWSGADLDITNGGTGASTASAARTALGVEIGVNVQAYDADLTTWAGITPGTGVGTFLATPTSANLASAVTDETGSGSLVFANSPTLVTPTLGAASATSLTTTGAIELGNASDTTLARSSAGNVTIEGNLIYRAGGTDVPITDGGTGASDAATAFGNIKQAASDTATGVVELATNAETITGTDTARAVTPANVAAKTIKDWVTVVVEAPANTDYPLITDTPYGFTITEIATRCTSGTCTATFKIGTTALGGTANSVSSTEQKQAHASANVLATGDDLNMTISSNSSCVRMTATIKFTRALGT